MRSNLIAALFGTVLIVAGGLSAVAEMGPPVPAEKKIIGWATDRIEGKHFPEVLVQVERFPVDGIVISVCRDDWELSERGRYPWFGGRRHTLDDFAETIAGLKATSFWRLTDNFIDFQTAARAVTVEAESNVDWFDPNWSVVAENGAIAAHIAREAGFKGLFMDVEPYSGALGPWRYPFDYASYVKYSQEAGRTPRSFDECTAQVRQRGREFMEAVTAVYPDITIMMITDTGWAGGPLVRSFVEGMLERIGEATLGDGMEQAYPYVIYQQFFNLRKGVKAGRASSPLYNDVEYGFGLWVDPGANRDGFVWHTDPNDWGKNYRSPIRFEHALYNALTAADRYVWLYAYSAFRSTIWWCPDYGRGEGWGRDLPEAYLEAMRNCRKPHDLNWQPETQRVFVSFDGAIAVLGDQITDDAINLFNNPDFESWTAAEQPPDGWLLVGRTPIVIREETSPQSGHYSATLTTPPGQFGHVSLDQNFPADSLAGKTITLGVWVKSNAPGIGDLQILDRADQSEASNTSEPHPGDDTWRFLTVTRSIRNNATGNVLLRLKAVVPIIPQ
ncbi:MAG: hypothetical protein KAW89_03445 [Armatimonadetes bacterium]|nr:hypothetical protein [Armatimonadota bacterium]